MGSPICSEYPPSMLRDIITDGLKAFLLFKTNSRCPPRVPQEIVNAIPHPTALIDAVLQCIVGTGSLDKPGLDHNRLSAASVPPIFRQAILAHYMLLYRTNQNQPLIPPRQYHPPGTDEPDPILACSFLDEPLFYNSSLRLRLPNQEPDCPIPLQATPIHLIGIRSVRDLMSLPSYDVVPHEKIMQLNTTSRTKSLELSAKRTFSSPNDVLGQAPWFNLLPRVGGHGQNNRLTTNTLWQHLLPSEPLRALNQITAQDHATHLLPRPPLSWTNDPNHNSSYPIQIPTLPSSCDDTAASLTALQDMTSKEYGIGLRRVVYKRTATANLANITPTSLSDAHGWPKCLGRPLSVPWRTIFDSIADKTISESSHYYCMTMIYTALWCPNVLKMTPDTLPFIRPNGQRSHWSCCPRCAAEYTPLHAAFHCPGLPFFWSQVHRVLLAMLPHNILLPQALLSISDMEVPCCGLSLLSDPTKASSERSLVIDVFACAFKSLISTTRTVRFQQPLQSDAERTDFHTFATSKFLSNWCSHLRNKCKQLSSTLSKTKAGHTSPPVLVQSLVVSASLQVTHITTGSRPPKSKDDLYRDQCSLIHTYFPYLHFSQPDPLDNAGLDPTQERALRISPPTFSFPPATPIPRVLPPYVIAVPANPHAQVGPAHGPVPPPVPPVRPPPNYPSSALPVNASVIDFFSVGSCRNNGRPNAKAGSAIMCPQDPALDYSAPLAPTFPQTNNTAELQGVISALRAAQSKSVPGGPLIVPQIYTDSAYTIELVLSHLPFWHAGVPLQDKANFSLIQTIRDLSRAQPVIWQHVRAHTTSRDYASFYNQIVDRAAKRTTIGVG